MQIQLLKKLRDHSFVVHVPGDEQSCLGLDLMCITSEYKEAQKPCKLLWQLWGRGGGVKEHNHWAIQFRIAPLRLHMDCK